jgi:predicted kinase
MPKLFLLQMAGQSGVGKSTLAARIAARTGAVILDMDVVKSVALDAGAEWQLAGGISHRTVNALGDSLLGQGFSVILDRPCRFEQIVADSMAVAERREATYCFIECVLDDTGELGRRIRSRQRLRSQMVDYGVSSPDAPRGASMADLRRNLGPEAFTTKYPPTPWLQIDTKQDPDRCLESALEYLSSRLEQPR